MTARRNLPHPPTAVPPDLRPNYEAITDLTDPRLEGLEIVSSPEVAAVLFSAAFINTRIAAAPVSDASSAEEAIHSSVAGVAPTIEDLPPESLGPQWSNKYPPASGDVIAPLVGSLFWDAKQGPPPAPSSGERPSTGLFETKIW